MDSKLYQEIGKSVELAKKRGGSLTEQNLLYVAKVADDVSKKTGVDFETLLGEGVIAMSKFEKDYDPAKNDSFVKGAAKHVRGYMMNYVNRSGTLVHIPVNLLAGFKKGQERREDTNVEYTRIDASNYDSLGSEENLVFSMDRENIIQSSLDKLDRCGRIAIEMKLHRGKYAEIIPNENPNDDKVVYRYKNNIKAIADELEVPPNTANKIYKTALEKFTKYCQAAYKA